MPLNIGSLIKTGILSPVACQLSFTLTGLHTQHFGLLRTPKLDRSALPGYDCEAMIGSVSVDK